jgi:hypothetical protein
MENTELLNELTKMLKLKDISKSKEAYARIKTLNEEDWGMIVEEVSNSTVSRKVETMRQKLLRSAE